MSERSVCASRPLKLNHSYTGVTMTKTVCSIKGCGNTSKNVSERKDKVLFHQFPNRVFDFGRFVAWSNFAKLSSVTHADRICSDHFAPDDYSDATNALTSKLLPQSYLGHHFNPRLKKTAVPSVRPPKLTSDSEFRLDHRGPTSQRNRRGATPSTLSWYWTDRSVVYVDMHGFGYKLLRQGSRHMYFTCSATSECSGKTMTSKRYKNPRMLSGHTHDSDKTHLLYARCWQTFKRYTKNHYTMDKDQIIRGFKAKYPHFATPFNNLHIEASMERWISDIHNIRPKSPDDFDSEEVSNGELSDSESIPPTTTTVNIFHNPSSVYTKCAVPSCNNYFDRTRQEYAGKQYFPFPEDPETRVLWNRAIGKTDDWDPKDSLVCSSHFINSSFETNHHDDSRKELQVGAVPSLNLTISSNVLDPLAEGFADGGNDGNYDELIYAPVKTVNIPSTGNDDSPLSIPVVKVDKFFLQRAKEKALANLAAEKNEAAAGPNRSSTEVNVLRSVMVDPQDQEEVAFELLMDETEENVEEKEMRSCLEDSIHELTSMQRENNKNSVPKSSLPEKKRVLSNHEILNNAESLLRNRFKSKNPVLVSRHKSLKRLERIGGKPSVKGERKPAEKTETKPTKTNGEKPTEKSGEKKTPSKRPSSKVESPSSAKRKRPSGEELVDLEDQKEWRPSKWTVNKWTKAGLIPPDSPKKRHNKERNESETENEEDDEAGYTVVEPLNIRLNINNGTDVEDAGDKQDLSFLKNFEAKDEKSSTMEVPPFKRRSSEVAKRRKRKITPMSADSNSDGDIELIQESSSERRTSTLVENTDVKEEADDTAKITTSELLAVKEEEEEDDLEGQKEDQEEEKEEPEEKKEDTDEEKEEPEEEREELVEEVNVEAAVAAKVKQSNRPARKWPEASRTKKSDESKQKSLEKQVEPPGKRGSSVTAASSSIAVPTAAVGLIQELAHDIERGSSLLRSLKHLSRGVPKLEAFYIELQGWLATNQLHIAELLPLVKITSSKDSERSELSSRVPDSTSSPSRASHSPPPPVGNCRASPASDNEVLDRRSLALSLRPAKRVTSTPHKSDDSPFGGPGPSSRRTLTENSYSFTLLCPICEREGLARVFTKCYKCEYLFRQSRKKKIGHLSSCKREENGTDDTDCNACLVARMRRFKKELPVKQRTQQPSSPCYSEEENN